MRQQTIYNGNVTKYVYSATGEKLRVTHQTAVPNISVPIGSTRELAYYEIQYTDSTDYLLGGSLTLKNGRIDKYQFGEGYCQAERYIYNTSQDDFTFCYYDRDHLGNVRQVTEADGSREGNIIQKVNYYPFGAEFCDGTANNSVQPYKYNGKELDLMHGLNTYDYGARQYNPVTARWDRVDPLAEKYYSLSPYNYCGGNPIRFVDLHGDSLILSGSAEDIKATLKVYQDGLGGFYNVSLNNMGYVTLTPNMNKNPQEMTTSELTVFKKLMPILYEEKITKINVINNSAKVPIGDISTNSIDIGDISALNGYKHVTPISALMHETLENHYVQDPKFMTNNSNRVKYAHFHSMSFEHSYMGDGNVHNLYDSETGILDFRTYDPILNTYGESLEKIQFTNGNLR